MANWYDSMMGDPQSSSFGADDIRAAYDSLIDRYRRLSANRRVGKTGMPMRPKEMAMDIPPELPDDRASFAPADMDIARESLAPLQETYVADAPSIVERIQAINEPRALQAPVAAPSPVNAQVGSGKAAYASQYKDIEDMLAEYTKPKKSDTPFLDFLQNTFANAAVYGQDNPNFLSALNEGAGRTVLTRNQERGADEERRMSALKALASIRNDALTRDYYDRKLQADSSNDAATRDYLNRKLGVDSGIDERRIAAQEKYYDALSRTADTRSTGAGRKFNPSQFNTLFSRAVKDLGEDAPSGEELAKVREQARMLVESGQEADPYTAASNLLQIQSKPKSGDIGSFVDLLKAKSASGDEKATDRLNRIMQRFQNEAE